MFGGPLWGGNLASTDHTLQERNPPARPLPLEFPDYVPSFTSRPLTQKDSSKIRDRICRLRGPGQITDEDLSSLNIHFQQDVDVNDLLPKSDFQERPLLFDHDLETLLGELTYENEDVYREILRLKPRSGQSRPRLTYSRNFFGSLEDLARYWDNTQDNYYETSDGTVTNKQPRNNEDPNAEIEDDSRDTKQNTREVYKGYRFGNGPQAPAGARIALVKNFLKMVAPKFSCRDHEPMPAPREKLVIRGLRIASIQYHFCVAKIPSDNKSARSRIVEGPLMAAHIREETRFKPANLVPSPACLLSNSTKTKKSSVSPSVSHSFTTERFDFFREIGCLLILANQRNRETKTKEVYTGADRWWIKQHRWGGGPTRWGQLAYEVYEDEDPSWSPAERKLQAEKRAREVEQQRIARDFTKENEIPTALVPFTTDDLMAKNAPNLPRIPGEPLQGPRKKKLRSLDKPPSKEDEMRDGRRLMYVPQFKKKWYQDWQHLRPNAPVWDDKIVYRKIGKEDKNEFDEVYMVSSVNHHVTLLKMRVHPEYLRWLDSGSKVSDEEVEGGLQKNVLYVQRGRWHDLFDIEARKAFLIVLWRLMCYMNRENIDKSEFQKMEGLRSGRM